MKTDTPKKRSQLTLRSMFMHMMENGYEPEFEDSHIQFGIGEDTAVIEHREGILSVRLFYSIDEEEMKKLIFASGVAAATIPAADISMAGIGKRKIVS